MKKIIILFIIINTVPLMAQFPYGFNYQAVSRDGAGNAQQFLPQNLRFTIALTSSTNVATYVETQTITTNNMGQFNCTVGQGNYESGVVTTFSNIAWQNNQYNLIVEVWGGGSYINIGNQQLMSVPYALTAPDPTPAGSVIAFFGSTIPNGWLLCDGSQVSRTTYSKLFASIGVASGNGNGTTTFHLPDLRGMFLRGVDGTANNDPDKLARTASNPGGNTGNTIGSKEGDAFQGHWHGVDAFIGTNGPGFLSNALPGTYLNIPTFYSNTNYKASNSITDGTNGVPRLSSETRPKNVFVNYIIKY